MSEVNTQNADAQITLKYKGKSVDNGEMLIEDVVASLKGFSTAYNQIASIYSPDIRYTLTLKSIQQGSFELVLNAFKDVDTQILIMNSLGTIATIVGTIFTIIGIRKQTKGQPYKIERKGNDFYIKIKGSNNTVQFISHNDKQNELYKVLSEVLKEDKKDQVHKGIQQMTSPLKEGEIDRTTLSYRDQKETREETIQASEKKYFDISSETKTTTQETKLIGEIRSLDKKTKNGKFIYGKRNKITLPMHLAMEEPEKYYHFFAIKEKIEIDCHIHLDDDLTPYKIEVFNMREIKGPQGTFQF